MFDEEGGGDHPHAVVHPARVPELAHARVDHRVAGPSPGPGSEVPVGFGAAPPAEIIEGVAPGANAIIRHLVDEMDAMFAAAEPRTKGFGNRVAVSPQPRPDKSVE